MTLYTKDVYIGELEKFGCEISDAGSRVTCSVVPDESDHDFLVYVSNKNNLGRIIEYLAKEKFEWEGNKEHYQHVADNGFMSWRKGDINFIVSSSFDFIQNHKLATALCKNIDELDKKKRIAIFQAILYRHVENYCEEILPF